METEFDVYNAAIIRRLRAKKIANMLVCLAIFILGVLSTLYRIRLLGSFVSCLREMTVDGTLFTSVVSLVYFIMNLYEITHDRELESHVLYYMRLSSAVTELVILMIVLLGYLPVVPDNPVIARFDMLNMHLIIPLLTILSFIFHDPSIGKVNALMLCNGLIYIVLYSVGIMSFLLLGLMTDEAAPYSFLRIHTNPIQYLLFSAVVIFGLGYLFSWILSELNRKATWLWFMNIARK